MLRRHLLVGLAALVRRAWPRRRRPAPRLTSSAAAGTATRCARVAVPLDRTGAVPGTVSLLVKRIRSRIQPARGAVFVLAGGPGQSATAAFAGDGVGLLFPAYRSRDVIVFDQRGTGRSGALRCRELERANLLSAEDAAGRCATRPAVAARLLHHARTRWRTWRPSAASSESTGSRSTAPRTGPRSPWPTRLATPRTWSASRSTRWWRPDGPDPLYADTHRRRAARPPGGVPEQRAPRSPAIRWPTSRTWWAGMRRHGRLRGPLVDAGGPHAAHVPGPQRPARAY